MLPIPEDYKEYNLDDRMDLVYAFAKYLEKCAVAADRSDVIPDIAAHVTALNTAMETTIRELELLSEFIDHEIAEKSESPQDKLLCELVNAAYNFFILVDNTDGTTRCITRTIMPEHKDEVLKYIEELSGNRAMNFVFSDEDLSSLDEFIEFIKGIKNDGKKFGGTQK